MLRTAIHSFIFGASVGAFGMFCLVGYEANQGYFQEKAMLDIAEKVTEQIQGDTPIPQAAMRYMKPMLSAEAAREVAELTNVPVPKNKPNTKGIGYSKEFRNQMTSLIKATYADEGRYD